MRTATSFLVIVLAGSCVYAQDQSLGDLARQQKSAAHAKAKRVFTDENLPHASPAEASNGALVMAKSVADTETTDRPATPKSNAAQAAPAETQKRVAELKETEQAEQRAVKKFEEELKDDSLSADRKQLFEDGLHNAQQLLAQTTAERIRAEKALGTKTDAADKSGDRAEADTSTSADPKPDASDKAADSAQANGNATADAKPDASDKAAEHNTDESKPEDPGKASPNDN